VKFIGFETKLKVDNSGDSLLGNLFLDAMRNISQSDFSISNIGMFKKAILPGTISYIDIMNMIRESEKLCITEVTGEELVAIIKNVQIGENAYQVTSGLRQTIKIDNNGTKNVTDIKLYLNNGNLVRIDKNKTYIMSSNSFILSEESGEDFKAKDVLSIIQDKFKKNKIKCEKTELGSLLVNYFHEKEVINITEEVNITRPRIIIQKEVDEGFMYYLFKKYFVKNEMNLKFKTIACIL
jgi:2',3'-cyclic-nucleotide 2'-phosphodiesterase (5'-nucleotidase family)